MNGWLLRQQRVSTTFQTLRSTPPEKAGAILTYILQTRKQASQAELDCPSVWTGTLTLEKGTKGVLSRLMSLEKGCFEALKKTPHPSFPQSFSLGRISPLEYLPNFGLTPHSRKEKTPFRGQKWDG